jgi:hypothetical protein
MDYKDVHFSGMKWDEMNKIICAEVDRLMATCSEEELDKRFLKHFGCINFQPEDFGKELYLAREYHKRHMAAHPGMHDFKVYDKWRCYEVRECKCGFNEECDSGD